MPADVIFEKDWAFTWAGERLLLENDQQRGILVFTTDTDLRLLTRCETIFADGTFKSSLVRYTQYLTVHGEIGCYVLKFACGILANKDAQNYARLFQVLKERIFNLFAAHLSPRNVIIDFEHSIIIALQQEFPGNEIYGCFFRFTKAIWRKIQEFRIDLSIRYSLFG